MNTLPSTHPPLAPPALAPSAARRAFTLIEVLVVISIIVILLAVSIPTIRALTNGNKQKQAVNLLSTMLANARSIAISTHKMTGIAVYEDASAAGQDSIQLVTQSGVNPAQRLRYFARVPRTDAQRMPSGIKVATLDDSGIFRTELSTGNNRCRAIMFESTGQMVLVNGLALDTSLSSANDTAAIAWNFNATSSSTLAAGVSSPGFLIYDSAAFASAYSTSPSTINTWLQQNADIIILNAYTGSAIR